MCRIAGIANSSFSEEGLIAQLKAMNSAQCHGGPDDEGFYTSPEKHLILGHRRLSILDLSQSGHQPMLSDDQKIVVAFNGEIYNFRSIKTLLQKTGYQFKSHTDTEVIIEAYQAWGTQAFSEFKGMFAFALYDVKQKQLHLVRDRQGIKPLYIYQKNDVTAFASEVKAFEATKLSLSVNPDWPVALLSMGHLPEPFTTFNEVKMLPKGGYETFSVGSDNPSQYHAFEKRAIDSESEAAGVQERIDQLLDQAIQSQLVADAPIGVFLSGGIDSSLLALQAAKYKEQQLATVSLNFEEKQFSEINFQQQISKMLPGAHHSKTINEKLFEEFLDGILENMDQPGVDGINTWFVSQAAQEAGLKAVLSGVGADEIFGGYPSFKRMRHISMLRSFSALAPYVNKVVKQDALKRWTYLNEKHPSFEYLFLRGFFNPEQLKALFGIHSKAQVQAFEKITTPQEVLPKRFDGKRAAWFEQHYFMQNQLLKDSDTMGMQHGLEIRVPFLDEDLVAYANQLPNSTLFPKNQPAKHLLINAFNGILPDTVWNRPKMGFTFPFQIWLKKHPSYLFLKHNHPQLESLFQQFEKDQLHWSKIMSLMVMQRFGGFDILSN